MDVATETNFLQALGWAVANSLWQMAAIWLLYKFIINTIYHLSSAKKAALASCFLFGGFAWFIYTFINFYNGIQSGNIPLSPLNFSNQPGFNHWLLSVLPYTSVLYLLLLLRQLISYIKKYRVVQIVRSNGIVGKIPAEWRLFLQKKAAEIGIKRKVVIWFSSLINSPITIGFIKPVILLPVAYFTQLSVPQAEAVLLHELAHIQRRDYFINLILKFIQAILYYNPFAKWLICEVEQEREKSCDEMVLQFQYDTFSYASALFLLEKNRAETRQFGVAATGKQNDLRRRIEWMMGLRKNNFFSLSNQLSNLAVLLCIVLINAALFLPEKNTGSAILTAPVALAQNKLLSKENIDTKPASISHPIATQKLQTTRTVNKENTDQSIQNSITIPENPFAMQASVLIAAAPKLALQEEAQVKEALDNSRRILQEKQWREIESSLGEMLTIAEKMKLKAEYVDAMNKVDLSYWGHQLEQAYSQINWSEVNGKIYAEINDIRLDSLQTVYANTMSRLTETKRAMSLRQLNHQPDAELSMEKLKIAEAQLTLSLEKIKTIRKQKVVKL